LIVQAKIVGTISLKKPDKNWITYYTVTLKKLFMKPKKNYRFTGKEGTSMSENVVKKWIQTHADHHEVRAHFFGREIIQKILNQEGCKGIRIYHAIDDKSKKQLILVGVDEKGNNMWPSSSKGKSKGKGNLTADDSQPCPPYCPPPGGG
jgi:hypothetical protein